MRLYLVEFLITTACCLVAGLGSELGLDAVSGNLAVITVASIPMGQGGACPQYLL